MDIRKCKCWGTNFLLVLVYLAGIICNGLLLASDDIIIYYLLDSHHVRDSSSSEGINVFIERLKNAARQRDDPYLAARIDYRLGVLYFRLQYWSKAEDHFSRLSYQTDIPLVLQVASLNMLGQVLRIEGATEDAAEAFDRLSCLMEQRFGTAYIFPENSCFRQLWCAALFARAEIFQGLQDLQKALEEYQRIIVLFNPSNKTDESNNLKATAYDRIADLHFTLGNQTEYMKLAEDIAVHFPRYWRLPLVKLESGCVQYCCDNSLSIDCGRFVRCLPAQLIGNAQSVSTCSVLQSLLGFLAELIDEYKQSPCIPILQYHYASLLDALGQQAQATVLFTKVIGSTGQHANSPWPCKDMTAIVHGYARLQYAVICTERGQYAKAINALEKIPTSSHQIHLSELAKTVRKNIETHNREARVHDHR